MFDTQFGEQHDCLNKWSWDRFFIVIVKQHKLANQPTGTRESSGIWELPVHGKPTMHSHSYHQWGVNSIHIKGTTILKTVLSYEMRLIFEFLNQVQLK